MQLERRRRRGAGFSRLDLGAQLAEQFGLGIAGDGFAVSFQKAVLRSPR